MSEGQIGRRSYEATVLVRIDDPLSMRVVSSASVRVTFKAGDDPREMLTRRALEVAAEEAQTGRSVSPRGGALGMGVEAITTELDDLVRAGLLCGYHREGRHWFVDWGGKRHRYTKVQILAALAERPSRGRNA